MLHAARRVWAVAAVHADVDRLVRLHGQLAGRLREGDRLVYLGNFLGRGPAVRETLDELLGFRRWLLAQPLVFAYDIAYLRGAQEEMWQKLLQLQFAPNPREVLTWMAKQGVEATLAAYGGDPQQGMAAAREGALSTTRWTGHLRAAMQSYPGHFQLMSALRRAAYTDDHGLLFVSAGLDPERPISEQSDSFWWGAAGFGALDTPYGECRQVVRGYDPSHEGVRRGLFASTIDAGCGFGGPLVAACFEATGEVEDLIEV